MHGGHPSQERALPVGGRGDGPGVPPGVHVMGAVCSLSSDKSGMTCIIMRMVS